MIGLATPSLQCQNAVRFQNDIHVFELISESILAFVEHIQNSHDDGNGKSAMSTLFTSGSLKDMERTTAPPCGQDTSRQRATVPFFLVSFPPVFSHFPSFFTFPHCYRGKFCSYLNHYKTFRLLLTNLAVQLRLTNSLEIPVCNDNEWFYVQNILNSNSPKDINE